MSFMFVGDDKTHFSWRLEAACPSEALVPIYEEQTRHISGESDLYT